MRENRTEGLMRQMANMSADMSKVLAALQEQHEAQTSFAQASAFSQKLLAARPAGGKKSRARRTIDYLAECHLIGGL